mgnify:FL=1
MKHGFTLIELLLVIGIILILSGIIVVAIEHKPDEELSKECRNYEQESLDFIPEKCYQYFINYLRDKQAENN